MAPEDKHRIENHFSRKPPRFKREDSVYFLTFCTYKRKLFLHEQNVPEMLIENLLFYSRRLKELTAYTIMPNHIHLLVEIEKAVSLSNFLRDFKKHTAKEMKKILNSEDDHIWQPGTMDHCIRTSNTSSDLENHVQYIFYNSWKHLGIAPRDFPYHNFSEIVGRGWLDPDFCVFDEKGLSKKELYE